MEIGKHDTGTGRKGLNIQEIRCKMCMCVMCMFHINRLGILVDRRHH